MHSKLSSVLLSGVIMMATSVVAQSPAARQATAYPLDVTLTYNATQSNAVTSNSFWMQGGSVQVHGTFYRGLGVVADIAGMHTANIRTSGVSMDMVTSTFGPRYTWHPAHSRYALFGQALGGEANAFNTVFPATTGALASASSLAMQLGGGMNISLSPRIALRAVEANWVRTQLPNSTTNVQNNLRIGAGIVVRIR